MPGPIDSLRFVHAALCVEADAFERNVREAANPADVAPLHKGFGILAEISEYHTRGEEIGLFPALKERSADIDTTYLYDHEDERAMFLEIQDNLAASSRGDEKALARLKRQSVAFNEHLQTHVRKENELILPYVSKNFSPPEQGAMLQKILSTIPQDAMSWAVPWVVERQLPDAAEAYVRALMGAMPPPVFEAAKGWIREGCSEARVADLQSRIPELA
jgi:hypothetical protein